MPVTKTLNPLPFGDLEPHRFEDLVRQLAYDFKDWHQIEATGRSGSDETFDIRATEKQINEEVENNGEDNSHEKASITAGRLWLIQCKREKSITPKKIEGYADEIIKNDGSILHGVIFAAACDFSKKTRDAFLIKLRDAGIQEIYLWGKAEIEDMLFQPKNDHLLFAYFGISLVSRKRSRTTQIKSKLAIKKKLFKVFGKETFSEILIRDANDDLYPWAKNVPDFSKSPPWEVCTGVKVRYDGLHVQNINRFAYLDPETKKWDLVKGLDSSYRDYTLLDLRDEKTKKEEEEKLERARGFWWKMPECHRADFCFYRVIPFEKIVAIDEEGDEFCKFPHVYTYYENGKMPTSGDYPEIKTAGLGRVKIRPKKGDHIKFFPKKFSKPKLLQPLGEDQKK